MRSKMRIARLYQPSPLIPHSEVTLCDGAARHAATVLRLRVGDAVELFDGQGQAARGELTAVTRRRVTARLDEVTSRSVEPPLAVTLALGVAKGERMDYSIQKSVELGVSVIQPLLTERSVVRLDEARAGRRVAHWQRIIISACEQSGRYHVPDIAPPVSLSEWLPGCGRPGGLRLMPTPGAAVGLGAIRLARDRSVSVLIGPEGGLSPGERALAEQAQFTPVRVGPRVLRTETAAVAVLAAVMTLWGDLG